MTDSADDLPDDIERLKALLLAERSEKARLADQNERLLHMLRQLRRNHFGRKSERLNPDQLNLGLEDLETAIASGEAAAEKANATLKASRARERRVNRGNLPSHLPREEVVIEPPSKRCSCCGGTLHCIGEDRSERLDKIPAKYRVIVTRRPKYACRTCEKTGAETVAGVIQAPAAARLVEGGLPTEALVADVIVSKYAWHLPLYRQSQMMATEGIEIDRSTLAHWVGFAAFELRPVYERLIVLLKRSGKLFADETRCPVLDPGRGRTKTGYLWAIARDDRPWGGADPPAVAYMYAPGRGAEHAIRHLCGFRGTLQVDAYVAYKLPIIFLMEEFASLGHMPIMEAAAAYFPGFGVKLWCVLQDLGQLQRHYKAGWQTFLGNAGVLQFFGNGDKVTLDYISDRLGSLSFVRGKFGATGEDDEKGRDYVDKERLLYPHETAEAFARGTGAQLLIVEGQPPMAIERLSFDDVHRLKTAQWQRQVP